LKAVGSGNLIWDANQSVYWLADANLAASLFTNTSLAAAINNYDPQLIPQIRADGTMQFPIAVEWVNDLNHILYLGRQDWRLPNNPAKDSSCLVKNFGPNCTGSDLGSLYSFGLGTSFPDSVLPDPDPLVKWDRLRNPQDLYWSATTPDCDNADVFSFVEGASGRNTIRYNYFDVLPMAVTPMSTWPSLSCTGFVAYPSSSAQFGKAIFDCATHLTWVADADLATTHNFGLPNCQPVALPNPGSPSVDAGTLDAGVCPGIDAGGNHSTIPVPVIDPSGSMSFDTANAFVQQMNSAAFAGISSWQLPGDADLTTLDIDLTATAGNDAGDPETQTVGPFANLQPYFYWACNPDPSNPGKCLPAPSSCVGTKCPSMAWSFDMEDGFEGTDETSRYFFVMINRPGSPPPGPPITCWNPPTCCDLAGGTWTGTECI
jgi:hypothetical protein